MLINIKIFQFVIKFSNYFILFSSKYSRDNCVNKLAYDKIYLDKIKGMSGILGYKLTKEYIENEKIAKVSTKITY